MTPLRVAHYLPRIDLAEGGVVRAVLDLCGVLASRGHAVTLCTHDPKDVPAGWNGSGVGSAGGGGAGLPRVERVPAPSGPGGLFARGQLGGLETSIRGADVAHLHTPWDLANLQLSRVARRAGTPYIVTIHGMLDDWSMAQKKTKKRVYHALFARRLLEGAAAVHCTAEAELAQAQRWLGRGRGVVAPLIFDLEPFRALPGEWLARETWPEAFASGEPVVLFLSRLHPKKGVHVLLEAVALLRDRSSPVQLIVAGTGDEPYASELRAQAGRLDLGERTRFVGLVTGELKSSLYQAADMLALPTSQENFGFVVPEALACRTPAITTRGVDIWPELERSEGALIVEQSAEAFANAIAALAGDAARRRAMGEAGRAWVMATLDPSAVAARIEAMYADAIVGGNDQGKQDREEHGRASA